MGLGGFVLRRMVRGALTLWFVVTLVFVATRLTGDPTDWLLPSEAGPEARKALREYLGTDKPILEQYLIYMNGVVHGDFGMSFYEHRPVSAVFLERLPLTMKLMGVSLVLVITVGVLVGILAALTRNSALDRFLMSLSFLAYSVPNFVVGIGLIFVFSLILRKLPSGGHGGWQHYIMPAITLGASNAALIARVMRSSMLDVLRQDYVRTARAKGLPEHIIVAKHCLRNAFGPVLTLVGMLMTSLVGGSVVIERVFAWPGAGRLIVDSVLNRDFPVLQLAVVGVAVAVVTLSILVDIGYVIIDPRIRLEG